MNINELPSSIKERLDYLFTIKKRYFYQELLALVEDLAEKVGAIDQVFMKTTRTIYERASKPIYNYYKKVFPSYIANFNEVANSNGNWYDAKFYIKK